MSRSSRLTYSAAFAGILLFAACAAGAAPGRVYVADRPPAVRVEVAPASPGRDFFWIGGHWRRAGHQWDWVPGRYVRREANRRWVPGHWAHDRRGWYFVEGRWK